jgi:hypothetical protein
VFATFESCELLTWATVADQGQDCFILKKQCINILVIYAGNACIYIQALPVYIMPVAKYRKKYCIKDIRDSLRSSNTLCLWILFLALDMRGVSVSVSVS